MFFILSYISATLIMLYFDLYRENNKTSKNKGLEEV